MKSEIRNTMKIKRRYLGEIQRKAFDEMIFENFLAAYGRYDSFLIYNSFSTEARTDLIIEALIARGKRVYLPRVEGENIVAGPYGGMKKGAYGIYEPTGEKYKGAIDLTVVPLLAVNERGFRIGYGGGYYDRYLKNNDTLKVGLGYYFQFTGFDGEEYDIPLDEFICERGIYRFGKFDG